MNLCLGIKASQIGLYNDIIYNYIENVNSATHTYQFMSLMPQRHLLESIRRELLTAGLFNEFSVYFYSRAIMSIASACFHNKQLLYDEYCKQIVYETRYVSLSTKDRLLRNMLRFPSLYFFFWGVNRFRQIASVAFPNFNNF